MIYREIKVALGERSYPIYVGMDMMDALGSALERHGLTKSIAIVTDKNIASYYLDSLVKSLERSGFDVVPIVIPAGEQHKSLQRAGKVYSVLVERGIGRKSSILALGGGVIGDLSGFIAATYHRGIPFVQVPTTLLSQADSSVGGKTAVNHPLAKNMIGAFYQPRFVWTDITFLKTLPQREIVCGLGEIVKYGVILDRNLFEFIESHLEKILALDKETILHVQGACCSIKAGLVSKDEWESGIRVVLNYGHTIGHALEAAGSYRILKHGEAVLLGMVAESYIAREMGLLPAETHDRVVRLIARVPLQQRKNLFRSPDVLRAMGRDKKNIKGKKRFVLPVRIGETTVVEDVPVELIRSSLHYVSGPRPWGRS